eukprot:bmy_18030T0
MRALDITSQKVMEKIIIKGRLFLSSGALEFRRMKTVKSHWTKKLDQCNLQANKDFGAASSSPQADIICIYPQKRFRQGHVGHVKTGSTELTAVHFNSQEWTTGKGTDPVDRENKFAVNGKASKLLQMRTFGALPVHEALLEESISRDFTGWPKQFVQNGVAGAEDWQQVGGALPDSAQPPVTLGERAGERRPPRSFPGASEQCSGWTLEPKGSVREPDGGNFINRREDPEAKQQTTSFQLHPGAAAEPVTRLRAKAARSGSAPPPRPGDWRRRRGAEHVTSTRFPPPPSGFSLTHRPRPPSPFPHCLSAGWRGRVSRLERRPTCISSAKPAAGGGVRRRRAGAASSVSRRGPLPELRRVPATLGAAAGTKEDPAAAAAAPPQPAALTRSRPAAAAANSGLPAPASLRARPGPTAPASRASPVPAAEG